MIAEEIWKQDLSEEMRIGTSTEGYDRVGLRCGADKMTVELRTTEDFSGVIYTQGSFHSREPSCFLDPVRGRSFTMNIPLNKCDTEKVSNFIYMYNFFLVIIMTLYFIKYLVYTLLQILYVIKTILVTMNFQAIYHRWNWICNLHTIFLNISRCI